MLANTHTRVQRAPAIASNLAGQRGQHVITDRGGRGGQRIMSQNLNENQTAGPRSQSPEHPVWNTVIVCRRLMALSAQRPIRSAPV